MPAKKNLSPAIIGLGIAFSASAQQTIKGTVIDKETRLPLEQATIREDKSGRTAISDANGNFVLPTASKDSAGIVVSYAGYAAVHYKFKIDIHPVIISMQKTELSLQDVVVTSGGNALSATKILSSLDLNARPAKTAQDLLRLVPGLFVVQHQGGGKAEGLALRGFDADHGTDISITVDGMPVNLPAHAHGQGYADLHFLIPELTGTYEWGKGTYYTDKGDFATAGFVSYSTKDFLNQNFVKTEGGLFSTARLAGALNLLNQKAKDKGRSLYVSGEAVYTNGGPFTKVPEHLQRYNLFSKFITPLNDKNTLTVEASTLWSRWRSSGEIPARAVTGGYAGSRWGAFDTSQTGFTTRTNAIVKLRSSLSNTLAWNNEAFYSNYFLNLYTNFTANYFFPAEGDEFRQFENRDLFGYRSTLSQTNYSGNIAFNTNYGVGFRTDIISPLGLDHTKQGIFLENIQLGKANETNLYAFADENIRSGKWLLNVGLRYDHFYFHYQNLSAGMYATNIFNGSAPHAQAASFSPKINIEYTCSAAFQLYLKTGKGFHSNDVRVVIARQGKNILPSAYGTDLGVNWKPFPRLFINTALWYLFLQSEFTYGSDLIDQPGGPVEAGGRTARAGIDLSGRYEITNWLYAALNLNFAHPRSIDGAKGQNYIPLAPTFTSTGELDLTFKNGWNGGINYRYMHNRAGNEDYSLTCKGYFVTDLAVNYTKRKYEAGLSIENLFNIKWDEVQREYVSQFKGEANAVDEMSYIPGVPFFPRLKFTVFF